MRQLAAAATGSLVALAVVLVHRSGALAVLLAAAASVATALWLLRGPRPALAAGYGVGWVALLGLVVAGRPEGDWAVGGDPAGYVVMGTGLLLLVLGAAGLPGRRHPPRT